MQWLFRVRLPATPYVNPCHVILRFCIPSLAAGRQTFMFWAKLMIAMHLLDKTRDLFAQ
jgi:hypothetical protein